MTDRIFTTISAAARGFRSSFAVGITAGCLILISGCANMREAREANRIPQFGIVDPNQPRELEMVSLPPYTVEPPDELEISAKPASLELPITTPTVQQDGVIDLGFFGEVYVAGLTLAQIERKVEIALNRHVQERNIKLDQPIQVSVRLVNGSSSN